MRGRLSSIDYEIPSVEARINDENTEKKEMTALIYPRVQLEGERGEAHED